MIAIVFFGIYLLSIVFVLFFVDVYLEKIHFRHIDLSNKVKREKIKIGRELIEDKECNDIRFFKISYTKESNIGKVRSRKLDYEPSVSTVFRRESINE